MTAKDYQDLGYRLSLQVSQSEIDRALYDVFCAYSEWLYPLTGLTPDEYETVRWHTWEGLRDMTVAQLQSDEMMKQSVYAWYKATLTLTVLLLMQRAAVGTRSGAKTPNITSAATPSGSDVIGQLGREAAMYMRQFADSMITTSDDESGIEAYRERLTHISDICGIFFVSNFLYN